MGKIKSYRELEVWKISKKLVINIYKLTNCIVIIFLIIIFNKRLMANYITIIKILYILNYWETAIIINHENALYNKRLVVIGIV